MELDPVLLARLQFAFTVTFHIIFPSFTIGLSAFIATLLLRWIITGRDYLHRLARFWTKIFAVSFAMGVVSGIVLSYQFGTNWSRFSVVVGNVVGPLIGYEVVTAFFLEATFLGVMLFGWKRVPRWLHVFSAIAVAVGILRGAEYGGVLGLAAGLLQDLLGGGPLGVNGLTKMVVGFASGLFERSIYIENPLLPAVAAFAGTLLSEALLLTVGQVTGLSGTVAASAPRVLTQAVLNAAHLCFAVLGLDMRSAQNTLRLKRALTSEGLPFQKLRFALNRAPGFTDLQGRSRVKRLAESLGISIDLQFPDGGRAVSESADQGIPLAESAPKNALRREIAKLAKSIHEVNLADAAPQKARALSKDVLVSKGDLKKVKKLLGR